MGTIHSALSNVLAWSTDFDGNSQLGGLNVIPNTVEFKLSQIKNNNPKTKRQTA